MLRNHSLITSTARGQLFDELAAARAFVRLVPWLDRLTLCQKARVVEIESHVQYDDWAASVASAELGHLVGDWESSAVYCPGRVWAIHVGHHISSGQPSRQERGLGNGQR